MTLRPRLKRWLRRNKAANASSAGAAPNGLTQLRLDEPRPWIGNYPDVPAPESKLTLQMFVARYTCGDIYGEDTPAIAADLLEAGYDTPSLRRLAGETQVHCHADAAELMDGIIREEGFPVPFPVTWARMLVTRQVARLVIAGKQGPWGAVTDLKLVWGWRARTDSHDVNIILNADDDVWDPDQQRFRPVVDADLLNSLARLARLTNEECAAASNPS